MKKYLGLLILVMIISSTSAQTQGQINKFRLSEDHEIEAYASAKLTWEEDQSQPVRINLTMSDYRLNNSEIVIQVIQIFAFEENGQGEILKQNTTEQILTVSKPSIEYYEILDTPKAADRFHLNISIFAYPVGGGVDSESRRYSFRFPKDSTIVVQRDSLVPVINLYGFPPLTYFQFWIPIYGTFLIIMLSPAMVYGVQYISGRRSKSEEKSNSHTTEEVN